MERSIQSRYLNSQDQLIISLNQQIQAIYPLKQSYTSLQRYHIKLSNDFNTLLSQQDLLSQNYINKINDLQLLNEQLDLKKNRYIQELQHMENQKSKLNLQRKNIMTNCQALSNKYNLQTQQTLLLQGTYTSSIDRQRQLLQTITKTDQNISNYHKILSTLQHQLQLKKQDNLALKATIAKKTQLNNKLLTKLQHTQQQIKSIQSSNNHTIQQIKIISQNIDNLQLKINSNIKINHQLTDNILQKQQQINTLNSQKQYYLKLIQAQQAIKADLQLSHSKLTTLLDKKLKQIDRATKQSTQLKTKIKNQQQSNLKSIQYKQSLKAHLTQLLQANSILIQTLRKSCKQDQQVHKILYKKLQILDVVTNHHTDLDFTRSYNKILKQKTNQLHPDKKVQKLAHTWINQLTKLQNR